MFHWWVSDWLETNPVFLCSWIIWVVVSICLHELGHGIVAIWSGDPTPRALGHMTLNPFVHIPWPMAWIMFGLFGFTWGLMPVNPDNFRGRYDDAKVAAAGPGVNLLLAAACVVGSVGWLMVSGGVADNVRQNVATFLWAGVMINIMGVLFNLIPIPPLDGSKILADFVPSYRRFLYSEQGAMAALLAMVFFFSMGAEKIWHATFVLSDWALRNAAGAVGQVWTGRPF